MKANFLSVGSIRTSDVGRHGLATVFPQTMAAAASFDVELYGKVGATVLGYVGQHFSYQHGIAMFGGTYALGAVAVLAARVCFFKRDHISSDGQGALIFVARHFATKGRGFGIILLQFAPLRLEGNTSEDCKITFSFQRRGSPRLQQGTGA